MFSKLSCVYDLGLSLGPLDFSSPSKVPVAPRSSNRRGRARGHVRRLQALIWNPSRKPWGTAAPAFRARTSASASRLPSPLLYSTKLPSWRARAVRVKIPRSTPDEALVFAKASKGVKTQASGSEAFSTRLEFLGCYWQDF
ncbi:hypothetical protein R3P38DRAFT_3186271 [Favolaschia claudopus]|uniref:Uncharacterized protein n=1 Tax=Favolaschia claudopus TaxID=2862362 RepID=A0AAW0C024_9AGAR